LDILISSTCFLLAYLIKAEFDLNVFSQLLMFTNLLILIGLNILLNSLFAGLQDILRIFAVVFFANASYLVFDLILQQWYDYHIVPASVLIINILLSFVAFRAYRVINKYFFSYITTLYVSK
jgi:hypothetical protein